APARNARPTASCRLALAQRRPYLDGQPDQVDEAERVLLVVARAHGEAGDIQRVKRIGRRAAERLDVALVEPQRDFSGSVLAGGFEKGVEGFAQRGEPEAVIDHLRVIE